MTVGKLDGVLSVDDRVNQFFVVRLVGFIHALADVILHNVMVDLVKELALGFG